MALEIPTILVSLSASPIISFPLVPLAFDSLGNLGHLCATRRGHVLVDPAIAVPFGCMWRGAKSLKVMHSICVYIYIYIKLNYNDYYNTIPTIMSYVINIHDVYVYM